MELEKGFCFSSIDEAKNEIKKFCTEKFHPVVVKYSNKQKMSIGCKNENCTFVISCKKRKDGKVHITKFTQQHTCNILATQPKVSSRFVADNMLEPITDNPEISIGLIRNTLRRENSLKVPYMTAYRGKKIAHNIAFGEIEVDMRKRAVMPALN